jgi:thermitase
MHQRSVPSRWRVRVVVLVLGLVLASFGPMTAATGATESPPASYVPGQVVVSFKAGTNAAAREDAHRSAGGRVLQSIPQIDVELVAVAPGGEAAAIAAYRQHPAVEAASYNILGEYRSIRPTVPNDPRYRDQWYLREIGIEQAWTLTAGSRIRPLVAIIDSGLNINHEDLRGGQIVLVRDFTSGCPGGPGCGTGDISGHGSNVTGVLAASANNLRGIAGVCPMCRVMFLSNDPPSGSGVDAFATAAALVFAADNGAQVINASWGFPYAGLDASEYRALDRAMQYVLARNILFVQAAGNDYLASTDRRSFPDLVYGGHPQVIMVGATARNRQLASYTNRTYMPNSSPPFTMVVDIGAPGGDCPSGNQRPSCNILTTTNRGDYDAVQGTSFAAPIVAGVAGLVLASGLCSTAACLKQRILSTADSVPALAAGWPNGRFLNACRAVDSMNGIRC